MNAKTKIEWTDATWNPIRGCSRVSEGCRNCYAERQAARFSGFGRPYEGLAVLTEAGPRWTGKVRLIKDLLDQPLRWRKPRKIFVNSMSDLFHEGLEKRTIAAIFGIMALAGQHTFQVLTKRPQRFAGLLEHLSAEQCVSEAFQLIGAHPTCQMSHDWPLPNVWLGVSVEDQPTADARIPLLLAAPAAVRWVSYEPALGPVDFSAYLPGSPLATHHSPLSWIVCGGESGPKARPMHPDWARSARDQCQAAGVPFFFKQWGAWAPARDIMKAMGGGIFDFGSTPSHIFEDGVIVYRPSKKEYAGAFLAGREWLEFPK